MMTAFGTLLFLFEQNETLSNLWMAHFDTLLLTTLHTSSYNPQSESTSRDTTPLNVLVFPTRWNLIRTACDSQKKLSMALELSADLPSPEVLDSWCGEPIKALIVPTSVFLTNKKGYPVLSRAHQAFVKRCYKVCAQHGTTATCKIAACWIFSPTWICEQDSNVVCS